MTHYCHGENLFFSYCLCSFRFTGMLLFLLTLGSEYFVIYFFHFFVHYSFIRDMILSSYFIKRFKNIRMKKRETNYFFVTNMYGMISDRALKRSLNSFFALKLVFFYFAFSNGTFLSSGCYHFFQIIKFE